MKITYFLRERGSIDLDLFLILSSVMIFVSFVSSLFFTSSRLGFGSLNLILSNSLIFLYIVYGTENYFFLASLLVLLSSWIYYLIRAHKTVLYEFYGTVIIMLFVFTMFFYYHVNIESVSSSSDVFNLFYFFSAVFHSLVFFSNFRSVGKYGRHV
ncbi:hypothetical protein N9N67_03200 [Bacteriovoracaceae bacterium]|nr:hypothetical protein [Bacteriovoracaceae bacterium]